MPPLEDMDRHHTAVLWPAIGLDDYANVTLGAAMELTPVNGTGVRWTWKHMLTNNAKGEPVSIDAIVVVDQPIPLGSKMWLGAVADFDDAVKGQVMEVVAYEAAPDLKARFEMQTVMLKYFGEDLPLPMS